MIAKLEMMGKQMHGTLSQTAITLWIHIFIGCKGHSSSISPVQERCKMQQIYVLYMRQKWHRIVNITSYI
jgi:hypothetical protein